MNGLLTKASALLITAATAILLKSADAGSVIELHGSGTTNPSKCIWHIMERIQEQAKKPLHMTYRAVGE